MFDPSGNTPDIQSAASLLSSGDVYSGAYNFMSSISAGVDPRTGRSRPRSACPPAPPTICADPSASCA